MVLPVPVSAGAWNRRGFLPAVLDGHFSIFFVFGVISNVFFVRAAVLTIFWDDYLPSSAET
jgi:hypothetical protein